MAIHPQIAIELYNRHPSHQKFPQFLITVAEFNSFNDTVKHDFHIQFSLQTKPVYITRFHN